MHLLQACSWECVWELVKKWEEGSQWPGGQGNHSDGPQKVGETGWKKRHEAQEGKMQSPGAQRHGHNSILGLGLDWLRKGSVEKDFWILWQQVKHACVLSPWDWRTIPYWAVLLHHGQVKGSDSCPLLGTCESMPGWLCLPLSSLVLREKHKSGKISQRHIMVVKVTHIQARELGLFVLMKRRVQKDLISVFSYRASKRHALFEGAWGEAEGL